MAELSGSERDSLPDSAFAYIESGGSKDSSGKTVPRSKRHFPIHDASHVRNALARIAQGAEFGEQAAPKVRAKAKELGIDGDGHDGDGRSMLERVPVERRFTRSPVECRAVTSGQRIGGYAAVFHTAGRPVLSRNLGGYVERVLPSAFNQCRHSAWPGVLCRYNHDTSMLLGTTAGRTLDLDVDGTGLRYDVLPPQARADILELVGRGDIQHSSFAFRVPAGGEEWSLSEQNYPMRSLVDLQLVDVAPVLEPAYPDATAGLRSLALFMDAEFEEVRKMADADELRRFFVRTGQPAGTPPPKKPQKKQMLGAAAMTALMARKFDPFVDEG